MEDELGYRFALYGALFLADRLPAEETFRRLKNIYAARSKLVHGSPPPKKKAKAERRRVDLAQAKKDARELSLAVALQVVEVGWPDHDALNLSALSAGIISPSGTAPSPAPQRMP